MGPVLKVLWDAVSGWLPTPEARVEVGPWVFFPLFGLLVAAVAWQHAHEFRDAYRKAAARGEGRQHIWINVILFAVIGAIGLWFIRS